MKKIGVIVGWWLFTVTTILIGAAVSSFSAKKEPVLLSYPESPQVTTSVDTLNPAAVSQVKGVETSVEVEDARPQIVANFLRRHDSPLQPYDYWGKKLVEIADRHGFDHRLLPAIAMQESNLCKRIPPGSYNCLGFGIHERGTLTFDNFESNFERAARELKRYYIDEGRTTPQKIMQKYTPSSDGSWARSVEQWMAEMQYDDREKGRSEKENADVHVLEYVGDPVAQ